MNCEPCYIVRMGLRSQRTFRRFRGSIATVLIVAVLCLGLVLTIAAMATTHLNLTNHIGNAMKARNAAESAIQTALAHLMEDPTLGSTANMGSLGLLTFDSGEATAHLAFDPAEATDAELPLSLNNVESDSPADGWKRVIPPEAIQLVAVGESGGVTRTIETVVHFPRFPYVICTSGKFESQGPLVLGVLPETAEAEWVQTEDLLPGHLASNNTETDAVRLQDVAIITGDVESAGGIQAEPPVVIQGSRLTDSDPVDIPKLELSDYDPEFKAGCETFSGSTEDTVLAGYNRSPGSIVVDGDLTLEAGVLYVAGDLTVTGDVKGRGAIFTQGNLTLSGCADLESDQQIALIAEGDVGLEGAGRFRGVVYTEGNFSADGVALVGAFIGNSDSGAGAIRIVDAGLVATDPTMSFADNWLCSQTTTRGLWWGGPDIFGPYNEPYPNFYPADFPTWRQTSQFVGEEDGLLVVEWRLEGFFPGANGELPEIYPRREYYQPDGTLVRVSFEGPDGAAVAPGTMVTNADPIVPGAETWVSSYDQEGSLAGSLTVARQDQEALARPERVQVYQEVADFNLDISQFFSYEDRMQTLLWVEH